MCEISTKIKFCTCSSNVENLKHYWVLHRKIKDKNLRNHVLGLLSCPSEKELDYFLINSSTIENRLNESDAFDVPMNFINKDVLEVVINSKSENYEDCFSYSFEYKKGIWKSIEHSPFSLIGDFEEADTGKMRSVLKRR